MKVVVNITLKNGVLDPQGKAIEKALHSLDFNNISNVKTSKQITFDIDKNDKNEVLKQTDTMCKELLANVVIEDYEIII
ncbi:phosphoribosylformylglycinamidine synthase subunit PurS [Campylobacter insulaenigrae]|uniref:Phosphoribosylformylglycinamidine synthase subunit PurS n=1 Tax=Campylobacter insulaenigrae NCTC 12927 TaxID=1031564 RepID=A0A0A8H152_9BACT|nr:phosphoribosylformylglycinamidine synthase subunit PurS [Campylobacter insulaenigrae]AJC87657.1 phosphoribosylformylglycinamidine synthase PurLQS, PurS subunit [Campylobacter insulaenigrae NCTC 12927]MCR6590641.1 phosphoribosylformylglycinamidine synthase subunit PurS [Campylobacter insulaenigrae]MCR6592178.1 phosphoribosylformylglycinamidine synthase subunit PurS [Campylobacter insulaenigrae]VEH93776.1 phosphoribosylformylglycinamidine synthase, PurS subunit [Campylobacter insulaenigrae]VE